MSTIPSLDTIHIPPVQGISPSHESAREVSLPNIVNTASKDELTVSPLSKVQSEKEYVISLGMRARVTDHILGRADELVEKMKTQLSSITKQFPPLSQDSVERAKYLNGFSSLRAQVEVLTIPRDPDVNSEWANIKFPTGQVAGAIPKLDSSTSTDDEIRQAETSLEKVGNDLISQRHGLYESIMAVVNDGAANDAALKLVQNIQNRLAA